MVGEVCPTYGGMRRQVHAGREQMGGPRGASRVHRGTLVEAAGLQRGTKGLWHAVARHEALRRWTSRHHDGPGPEKPHWVAVGCPGLAEPRQSRGGQWLRTVLGAGATAHVDASGGPYPGRECASGEPSCRRRPQVERVVRQVTLPRSPHTREDRTPSSRLRRTGRLCAWGGRTKVSVVPSRVRVGS